MKTPDMNPDHVPGVLRVRDGYLSIVGGNLGAHLKTWADDAGVTPETPVNIIRHDTLVALMRELHFLRSLTLAA